MGGRVIGPFGGCPMGGDLCFGGGLPQYGQPRMGVAEEMKSMEMRKKAYILEESIFLGDSLWNREREREREREVI
jgi:hypothetical protein